jgi:hypothetical protein
MRITAITIRVWIQPPVRGNLGLMFRPKKPSSHRMIKITMIVHNMRFLLLNEHFESARMVNREMVGYTGWTWRFDRTVSLTA